MIWLLLDTLITKWDKSPGKQKLEKKEGDGSNGGPHTASQSPSNGSGQMGKMGLAGQMGTWRTSSGHLWLTWV